NQPAKTVKRPAVFSAKSRLPGELPLRWETPKKYVQYKHVRDLEAEIARRLPEAQAMPRVKAPYTEGREHYRPGKSPRLMIAGTSPQAIGRVANRLIIAHDASADALKQIHAKAEEHMIPGAVRLYRRVGIPYQPPIMVEQTRAVVANDDIETEQDAQAAEEPRRTTEKVAESVRKAVETVRRAIE